MIQRRGRSAGLSIILGTYLHVGTNMFIHSSFNLQLLHHFPIDVTRFL